MPPRCLPSELPRPIEYCSQRRFVRDVLKREVDLRAFGTEPVSKSEAAEEQPVQRLPRADERGRLSVRDHRRGMALGAGTELTTRPPTFKRSGGNQKKGLHANETERKVVGMNRTGLAASPLDLPEVLQVTRMTRPSSQGQSADALSTRQEYARET